MRDSKITGKERLLHITQAISEIESYTKDVAKESFLANRVLIGATLFQFTIIGEAIIHIDDEILSKYDYPWYKVRGFRNFIIHEYHAIEFRIVWEAIEKDLPELKRITERILDCEF
ncbi:DUF86 domain-containing protein [bacterium]|nr:DUF86 domain-containing protein [bacterium]